MQGQWNKWIYLGVVMFAGAICGSILLQALPAVQQEELNRGMVHYVGWLQQAAFLDRADLFWNTFFKHMKWAVAFILLGISIIGVPIVVILNFLKGFLLGSSIFMLTQAFGTEGIWLSLLTIAPHNIVVIPALIVLSSSAISFAAFLFNNRIRKHQGVLSSQLLSFSTIATAMLLLLAAASLIEVFVTPKLLEWYSSNTELL
ncbi:stage II sporulation protein M [Paenibacillus camelliae]|uniref:stage II sporulation protein M n=1 Tax=Paenibacillus camelliae TaxID=512410 RepID=UPI00203C1CD4|nr:stage II sporulation protein M [Paenibacillus camelliae]MCM3633133.1 stage II sporulation protein M [Paenibacillus camelliae]